MTQEMKQYIEQLLAQAQADDADIDVAQAVADKFSVSLDDAEMLISEVEYEMMMDAQGNNVMEEEASASLPGNVTANVEIPMNDLDKMILDWRTLKNQMAKMETAVEEEVVGPAPKYFAVMVKITDYSPDLVEGRKEFILDKSSMTTFCHIHMVENGHEPEFVEHQFASGKMLTIHESCVEAFQLREINLIRKESNGIKYWDDMASVVAYYEAEKKIKAKGRVIIGMVQDVILHVDPKDVPVMSTGWVKHRKRTQAPALKVVGEFNPAPAYIRTNVKFVDHTKFRTTGWSAGMDDVERNLDGVGIICESMFQIYSPIKLPQFRLGRDCQFTTRVLDYEGEISKTGFRIISDDEFQQLYWALTGETWYVGMPWIILPRVTMKGWEGEGVREKTIILHRMGWQYGMTQMSVSGGELTSTFYTEETRNVLKNKFTLNVEYTMARLKDKDRFVTLFKEGNTMAIVDELFDDGNQDDGNDAKMKAMLSVIVNSARDWIDVGLPVENIIGELVDFINKKIASSFRVRETVMNISTVGFMKYFPAGKLVRMPSTIRVHLQESLNNVPAEYKRFTKVIIVRDDNGKVDYNCSYMEINVKKMTKARGFMKIKRTPVVNGTYTFRYSQIIWDDASDVMETHPSISRFLTEDKDGDYLSCSWENPGEFYDLEQYTADMHTMEGEYKDALKAFMADNENDNDLETYNDVPDACAPFKILADALNAEYPENEMSAFVLSKGVGGLVGGLTNASIDSWIHLEPVFTSDDIAVMDLRTAMIAFHVMNRALIEGAIQAMKHPEVTVPFTPAMFREFVLFMMSKLFDGFALNAADVKGSADTSALIAPMKWLERSLRKGKRFPELIAGEITYSPDKEEQLKQIFGMVKRLSKARKSNITMETREMNYREKLLVIENEMKAIHEAAGGAEYLSIHANAAAKLRDFNLDWTLERDERMDNAAAAVVKLLIAAEREDGRAGHDIFFNDSLDDEGNARFDIKSPVGQAFLAYFGDKTKTAADKLKVIRTFGAHMPVIALAIKVNASRRRSMGHIITDGYTKAELAAYKQLLDIVTPDQENYTSPSLDISQIFTLHGTKLVYIPADQLYINEKKGRLWLANDATDDTKDGWRYLVAAAAEHGISLNDLRRGLCKGQLRSSIRVIKDIGIISDFDADTIDMLRGNTTYYIAATVTRLKGNEVKVPPNVRIV
jgi:hypothetical protein